MEENVTVSMPLYQWEREKRRIESEAYEKGVTAGHQSVWRFIQQALINPGTPLSYGKGFPEDLREIVNKVVYWAAEKKKENR